MNRVVFLTGATGFLGTWIARRLLAEPDVAIVALVRAADSSAATQRLTRAWWDWPELAGAVGGRVEAAAGDVAAARFGLDDATYDGLIRRVTHIIHTAADLRVDRPLAELRRTNRDGVENILMLARAIHQDHGLDRFSHLSTAYVCGRRQGAIPEAVLTDAFGFANGYERTKFEGESLVRAAMTEFPVSVVRPGMVVGDSRTGEIATFNTIYYPLRLYLTGQLRFLPARADQPLDLIPVDDVAEAVVRLTFDPRAAGATVHLTPPPEARPTVGELAAFARAWAHDRLRVKLRRVPIVPIPALGAIARSRAPVSTLTPYLTRRRQFQRETADRLLGPYRRDWQAYLPVLLDYAVAKGFMHRSERTVHEQIVYRLGRSSRRVTYHDVVDGTIATRSAEEVRTEALAAASALRSFGVGPGDRVAVVGLNSSRYLALDVAIGLSGAVGVPLYYTSPPAEIDTVVRASGARLLFAGAPAVLDRLAEITAAVPIVSFGREQPPRGTSHPVIGWDEFLARGRGCQEETAAPVGFGDPATLRYTSGTTGQPKGVVFTHGQLRWMAETMAALLPWRARITPARYLSFLPMNHVVEGILATYAPYVLPAPVEIFFLEDFRELGRVLPRVRPTIFFAVPRVYEKIWAALPTTRIGRLYTGLHEGPLKRVLRGPVRWGLLRRAGLDRCAQLIVGSAPTDEEMIRSFHNLGVEIHNAYGLTEAPLVTLNRYGANRIGTVGEPLPETEVRIGDDGEVMVRGPQVTAGFFESEDVSPIADGWLRTGDLGSLTAAGSLVIHGRKKDVIATSYGKKIFPAKIEAMLREIPGVAEAMVVGEDRPYCTAVLWTNDGEATETIDRGVAAVNDRLSHPEQVKRWAVLANDLSIERGDLTANLKLRRQTVASRLDDTTAALYGDGRPAGVLHIGGVAPYGGAR